MDKNQRRYLSRFACAWCDQPMSRDNCGAVYEKCSEEVRAKRRAECLKEYRPRVRLVAVGGREE